MHIGILSDPNNFHTRKWAKALQSQGAMVTVFSLDGGECGTVESVQIVAKGKQPGQFNYATYLQTGDLLAKALKKHGVEVVNALNITPFGVWAARSGFRPVIFSALGADILEYPPKGVQSDYLKSRSWANVDGKKGSLAAWKDRLLRNYYRKKVAEALKFADLITGDNQLLVDAMHDWFGVPKEKLRLLRWGVEPELFQATPQEHERVRQKFGIQPGQKVVLAPRGAKALYQADIILDAFEKILQSGRTDTRLLLFSAGYEISERVASKAAQLQKTYPHFQFVSGLIPREEMYVLWNLVDIMISAPVYDGYSAAVAEARYAGAIPLVNDIPGNREVIRHGENGWICADFNVDGLARDLNLLLDQLPAYKSKFAATNRAWIEQNSLVARNAEICLRWAEELVK